MSPISNNSSQLQMLSDSDHRVTKCPVANNSVANDGLAVNAVILGEVGCTGWDFQANHG